MTQRLDPTPRRAFVRGLALSALAPLPWLGGCATPATTGTAAAPNAPARDQHDSAREYRIANRVSWGASDAEVQRVRDLGPEVYLQRQLRAQLGPLPPAVQAGIAALTISRRSPQDLWHEIEAARQAGEALPEQDSRKAAQQAYQQALNKLARECASRQLLRSLYAPNQLLEQMQWFWFNHFNVHQYKANIRVLLADYEEHAIRPHALGRFRDLVGAVTRHPAMLRYLDNEHNAVGRINENHARELLELHTLGVDGGYSQGDVQELARVLTGHGVNFGDRAPHLRKELQAQYVRAGLYEFHPQRHDPGTKTVLGRTIAPRGAAELDEVLDHVVAQPACARFVCRKIARHLLADEPPPAVVDAMTAAWSRSGGQIAEVLGVLLRRPEFGAPGPGKFRDPMHYVISAVRACHGERVILDTQPMQGWLNRMGEGLYNRPTPDGYPDNAASWASSGQLAARLDIARALGSGSAGLFRYEQMQGDGSMAMRDEPAFPVLSRPLYWQVLRPMMAANTRAALDGAASPQDWNALYLSAPEFMYL
ncbi:MAG: DUF1800 domain-containing protein [Burkholderiales bacterium]|nr:DUF1800 domain-containing protein [Burkholderiales bacterium]